jgi:hypothetical protein
MVWARTTTKPHRGADGAYAVNIAGRPLELQLGRRKEAPPSGQLAAYSAELVPFGASSRTQQRSTSRVPPSCCDRAVGHTR